MSSIPGRGIRVREKIQVVPSVGVGGKIRTCRYASMWIGLVVPCPPMKLRQILKIDFLLCKSRFSAEIL